MSQLDSLKQFIGGGMDNESAYPDILKQDWITQFNGRVTGTSESESGYVTNIESNVLVPNTLSTGINQCIGAEGFELLRGAIGFIYNSAGFHQIAWLNYDTNTITTLFTDKTNSGGISILPLNPQFYVCDIKLIDNDFIFFTDNNCEPGFFNLTKLMAGGYGTLLPEDLKLVKPQILPPPTSVYNNDAGRPSNLLREKIFQIIAQAEGFDYTFSAWSTHSKRTVPTSESTPTVGTDVTVNNNLIVSTDIGNSRVMTINIGARYDNLDFVMVKVVDRAYVLALPNTAVNVANEVYEAYDPTTNLYSFAFYNDGVYPAIDVLETDLAYDKVPLLAETCENINSNEIALAGITEGYTRPVTPVVVKAVGYDPNVTVTPPTSYIPLSIKFIFPGESGSGAGDHKRIMQVLYTGVPKTGDILTITLADIRNATATNVYSYTVPSSQNNNLAAVINSFAQTIPNASQFSDDAYATTNGISFIGSPYYGLQSATITLFNAGVTISKSVHGFLDNSSYQAALSFRDAYGRFFPLDTDNTFVFNTPSFAQLLGQSPAMSWTIQNAVAPVGAVDYQWLISKNTSATKVLDIMAGLINYVGGWNAHTNIPALGPSSAPAGTAYQITVPNLSTDTGYNLGNGFVNYKTGDYVISDGNVWNVLPGEFGDLTSTGSYLAFSLAPLAAFNKKNASNVTENSILFYDFTVGDRCTLHYYIDGSGNKVYINNPCVDLDVVAYDPSTNLVKVRKSASLDPATIAGKDVFLRLYTPELKLDVESTTTANEIVYYEIGERFTITNGLMNTLSGTITDGDVYFKSREMVGYVDPNTLYELKATDFNFSDFYISNYTSYGRPRTYDDELERTLRAASIRYSENYILGSKNNGLTRFFPENIYGDGPGESSSSYGTILKIQQRNESLICIQKLKVGYIPVYRSILEDTAEQKNYAISEKIFNKIEYNNNLNKGIGIAKESYTYYNGTAYWIDSYHCQPIRDGLDGMRVISGKMNKYFKDTLKTAFANNNKVTSYYDVYNEEWVVTIQLPQNVVQSFAFNTDNWQYLESYTILPTDITLVNNPSHGTVAFNATTGVATYTPTTGYTGADNFTFVFNQGGNSVTKKVCINVAAGVTTVNLFTFAAQTGVPLSTVINSNTISIQGNTIAVPISITGGQYAINGGSFTSLAGIVNPNDIVQVRQTSSASTNTETDTTLSVGTPPQTGVFAVTTGTTAVNPFSFTPKVNQPLSTLITSNIITVTGNTIPAAISITGGQYSINGGSFTNVAGTVNAGDTVQVEVLSSATINTLTSTTLTIDTQTGTFDVTTLEFGNVAIDDNYRKNDCISGETGTFVHVSIAANTYFDSTQAGADAQAQTAAQAEANSEGTCLLDTTISTVLVDYITDTTADLCCFVETTGLSESGQIVTGTIESPSGPLLLPNDGTDPSNCFLLSSDKLTGAVGWRFGINTAYFAAKYGGTALLSVTIRIQGRDVSSGAVTLRVGPRPITEGYLILGGSLGAMEPGVSSGTSVPTNYTSHIGSGADGTVGTGVGAPVLDLIYTFAVGITPDSLAVTTY
jgi:hypothetical protein